MASYRGKRAVEGPKTVIKADVPVYLRKRLDAEIRPPAYPDRATIIREACEQWLSRRNKIYGRQL